MLNRIICILIMGHRFDFTKCIPYVYRVDGSIVEKGSSYFCVRCNRFIKL